MHPGQSETSLSASLPPFNYALLIEALGPVGSRLNVEHLESCTSTNTALLERAAGGAPSGTVLVCDTQTAGRGRRGRRWVSTPGHSLTFSLLWKFPGRPQLNGLSLAIGVAIAQQLEQQGAAGIGLKWPNDVWLLGRKLGGVLIEVLFDSQSTGAVIGLGLNLRHDETWLPEVSQPFVALEEAIALPAREALLGGLLRQFVTVLETFSHRGFVGLRAEWEARNAFRGLPVRVESENGEHVGICEGVSPEGALELKQSCGAQLLITGGDVSLHVLESRAS